MALTLRTTKGSPLTHAEVDANFQHCAPTSGTTQANLDLLNEQLYAIAPSQLTPAIGAGMHLVSDGSAVFWENYSDSGLAEIISEDTTITVGPTGCDYTLLSDACNSLIGKFVSPGVNVTIEIDDVLITQPSDVIIYGGPGVVTIKGKTEITTALNSIQSSSGSSGNWSVVLNVGSVAGIAVGDYVLLVNCAGGTSPEKMNGCHYVNSVDVVNSRITVTSKAITGSFASGAVASSDLCVLKSKVTGAGFVLRPAIGANAHIENLAVLPTGASGYSVGIYCVTTSTTVLSKVGTYGGPTGMMSTLGANVGYQQCAFSGHSDIGVYTEFPNTFNGLVGTVPVALTGNYIGLRCSDNALFADRGNTIRISCNTFGVMANRGGRANLTYSASYILSNSTNYNITVNNVSSDMSFIQTV